jgi:integrase
MSAGDVGTKGDNPLQGVPIMLNDTQIKSIKPEAKPKKYFDGGGMFLYVPSSGSKLWRMAYRFNKKEKLLSLGEYPAVSLKAARERREDAKRLLSEGIDPGAHKRSIRDAKLAEEANSFEKLALEWYEGNTLDFTPKYRGHIIFRLNTYLLPAFGKIAISKLEPQDILAVVKPLEQKGLTETARRLVQITSKVMRYAVANGKAKHDITTDLRGALRPRRSAHRAAITEPQKVGALLRAIHSYMGYYPLCCALRLAPLFFVRPGELRLAEWSEFDFDAKEWRIPAYRMKMRQQHIVPLADQTVKILRELREHTGECKYLFPSVRTDDRTISDVTMLAALRRMGYEKHEMSAHGFRSTASTLLNELGYNRDWIERQLAHSERNDVRAAYNYAEYLPERRRMMQEWADYLDKLRADVPAKRKAI